MQQVIIQLITLWLSTISYVFSPTNVLNMMIFLARKFLLYTFFANVSLAVLIKYYMDYIPNMNQSVTMNFKQINEDNKYFGFAFESQYKIELCEADQGLKFDFPGNDTLRFDQQFICNIVINEEDNEIEFQSEFYQVWLRIKVIQFSIKKIKDQEASSAVKHLGIKSYMIYDDERYNIRYQAFMKLGDFYYSNWFKSLPIRLIIKLFNKVMTFLDLRESVDREGEVQLFSNIAINENNSKIKMLVIQVTSSKEIEAIGELSLSPQLKGFRYFIYFYFWTSLAVGTSSMLLLFIFLWEILLNPSFWRFMIKQIKQNSGWK